MPIQSIADRLQLPKGYHFIDSDKDCWSCLETLKDCEDVIAHDGEFGDVHPLHTLCMETMTKYFKVCSVCQEPLKSMIKPPFWKKKLELVSNIFSRTTASLNIGIDRLEKINGIFSGTIGAGIALASDSQVLKSGVIALGGAFGLLGTISKEVGFRDLSFLMLGLKAEDHETLILGYGLGVVAQTKTGGALVTGIAAGATVLSLGGGALMAITAGAFTGTAIEQIQKLKKLYPLFGYIS